MEPFYKVFLWCNTVVFPSFPSSAHSVSPVQPDAREPIPSSGGNGLLFYSDGDTENRQSRLRARAFHPPRRCAGADLPILCNLVHQHVSLAGLLNCGSRGGSYYGSTVPITTNDLRPIGYKRFLVGVRFAFIVIKPFPSRTLKSPAPMCGTALLPY